MPNEGPPIALRSDLALLRRYLGPNQTTYRAHAITCSPILGSYVTPVTAREAREALDRIERAVSQ